MALTAVIGAQWGDEGKGKVVDYLSKDVNIVARFQGGANAGHTIYKNGEKIVLHQIPSGIFEKNCICILGNGMVLDPVELVKEIDTIKKFNIDLKNKIKISLNAHIVTPIHKFIDINNEENSSSSIGTTCKGIGPTYVDKYNRIGIRAIDLLNVKNLKEKVENRLALAYKANEIAKNQNNDIVKQLKSFYNCCDAIMGYVDDTFTTIHNNMDNNILIEGAQGALLDIDFGTYPFVTSSNPSIGGISTGLGIPGSKIDTIIGIFKAYTTRVGKGPFPTELHDQIGEKLRKIGKEFGATTGRARRCGWFDGVAAKYSIMLNGITNIAITKLDILDNFKDIKFCIGYKINGKIVKNMSELIYNLDDVIPIYKQFEGWQCDTTSVSEFNKLPILAQNYLNFIYEFLETPVSFISNGPNTNQIIKNFNYSLN